MIAHGNKQISEIVYARKASEGGGAVRLTNIIRGAQVVFGGLRPSLVWQLLVATKAAILAAFGQTDGKAVIKATNAYLNALAATDPTKATALAGFINEDPMLVCSLGLKPQGVEMPIRKLVGDGVAWIDTPYHASNNTYMKFVGSVPRGTDGGVFGCCYKNGDYYGMYVYRINTNRFEVLVRPSFSNVSNNSNTGVHILEIDSSGFYEDGTKRWSVTANTFTTEHTIGLFYVKPPYKKISNSNAVSLEIRESGNEVANLVSFQLGEHRTAEQCYPKVEQAVGTKGMIDLVTGLFHPNSNTSGSFTIEYTLPDGTPWTPLNQTP